MPLQTSYQPFLPKEFSDREDYYLQGSHTPLRSTGDTLFSTMKFAASVAAIHGIGTRKFGNKRGYDYIIGGIRTVEEFSPARILRTFQLSHMLSPLETAARSTKYFSSDIISDIQKSAAGKAWLSYLSDLTGQNMLAGDILSEGFRFEKGQLRVGKTGGRVLLEHASVVRNLVAAEPRFQSAYARSLVGGPYANTRAIFMERIPFENALGKTEKEIFSFIGGKSRGQAVSRYISGYGTSLIERLNQLARAPAELPILSSVFGKLPSLGVVPSSGLRTLGKLTAKLGIGLPLAVFGYKQLDYYARQSSLLDDTIFSEGITSGVASIWANTQMGISKAADTFGLHSYREWQEKTAPGSTSLQKLLAFPLIGALGGIGANYAFRVYQQMGFMRSSGMTSHAASVAAAGAQELFLKGIGADFKQELIEAVPKSMLGFVEKEALSMSEGTLGTLAKKIVSTSENKGFLGRIAQRIIGKRPTFGSILGWTGAALGTLAVAPFLPGALLPSDRPEELEALYSGEKEIPIRKGRWWEMGRSPYEGGRIDRYEPHPVRRLRDRWTDVSIYGEELSPLEKWFRNTFTYKTEMEHYYDRPYPITSPAFSEVPILGPLLGATIGRLIKPPVMMHTNEFMGGGGTGEGYLGMPLRYGQRRPIEELGEKGPGVPISPWGVEGLVGEQTYNLTEAIGLPGFTMTSIKEAITGRQDLFDEEMQLAAAGEIYSPRRPFWSEELGGGLLTTELWRRLYPHSRRQIPLYNPIPNQMPEWMPGAEDKSINFRVGDPYAQIPHGEWRLPGAGYEARFPELKGLSPEDYPNIHKLRILADVAMYSDKYREMERIVRAQKRRGELTEQQIEMLAQIQEQVKSKKVRKEFSPYTYRERQHNNIAELALVKANEESKQEPGPSFFERTFGRYWEFLGHNVETPLEYLTPVSPGAKLVHMRTATEDYERTQLYGTERGFWQHPIRDFLKPLFYSSLHALGWSGVPGEIQEKRDVEEYFDILKYVKYTRLRQKALQEGDKDLVAEFEDKRRETLFGINPYGHIYTHIFRALPRGDRDYFNSFVKADAEEREEILKMIPENEKALYMARWQLEDVTNWKKAIKKGLLTEEEEKKAKEEINEAYSKSKTEGFPIDDDLFEEYLRTRMPGEKYSDWYRRKILLPEKLAGKVLPGPDWVGFNPAVDLEDIKLKVVQNIGGDPFMYDIWPDQVRTATGRPYLEEATEALEGSMDSEEVKKRVEAVLNANNIKVNSISVGSSYNKGLNEANITIKEDRSFDIRTMTKHGEE